MLGFVTRDERPAGGQDAVDIVETRRQGLVRVIGHTGVRRESDRRIRRMDVSSDIRENFEIDDAFELAAAGARNGVPTPQRWIRITPPPGSR